MAPSTRRIIRIDDDDTPTRIPAPVANLSLSASRKYKRKQAKKTVKAIKDGAHKSSSSSSQQDEVMANATNDARPSTSNDSNSL